MYLEEMGLARPGEGGRFFLEDLTGDVDVITKCPLVRLLGTAPVSREMILNYIAEHVLGLPRPY